MFGKLLLKAPLPVPVQEFIGKYHDLFDVLGAVVGMISLALLVIELSDTKVVVHKG